ncbi:MAG: metallophosphoesterase [Pyrinomonadaceae bacterium]
MMLPTAIINRLAWATDIHLDFATDKAVAKFCDAVADSRCDALLITGDIAEGTNVVDYLKALKASIEVPIYFVLGNHDFYGARIRDVRFAVQALSETHPKLYYLPVTGIVPLTTLTALVGCDGWGDAQLGKGFDSRLEIQDHYLIRDLAALPHVGRLARQRALGEEEAERVRKLLPEALEKHAHVIFATHVPPFREACWHRGKISDDDWLPHFTCKAVGDALLEMMRKHPTRQLTVLCGHTHGAGEAQILPNLFVRTGGARYGAPALQGVLD